MKSFLITTIILTIILSTSLWGTEWRIPVRFRPTSLDTIYHYIYYFGERENATDNYDPFIDLAIPIAPPEDEFFPYFEGDTTYDPPMPYFREDYRTVSEPGDGHVSYLWQLSFRDEPDESVWVIWEQDSFPHSPIEYPLYMHFIVSDAVPESVMWETATPITEQDSTFISVMQTVFFKYWDRTKIFEQPEIPENFEIKISPNPFNQFCRISSQGHESQISYVTIHDISGHCIAEFKMPDGEKEIIWYAENMNTGVYFLRTQIDGKIIERKVFLIK